MTHTVVYSRKVWQGEGWRTNSFQAFGERKLGLAN